MPPDQNQTGHDQRHKRSRTLLGLLVTLGVIALLVVMWQSLPRGYSTDLGLVGNGQPAVVLAHDDHRIASDEQMAALNEIRDGLEARDIQLLVANMRVEQGAAFAGAHGASPADVLVFDGNGSLLARIRGPLSGPQLRQQVLTALDPAQEPLE